MAEQERGLSRALSAPVRAVSQILRPPTNPPSSPAPNGPGLVDFALYVDGVRQDGEWTFKEAHEAAQRQGKAFVWIGLHEPTPDEFADIAEAFDLHELAVEDAVKSFQRPKLEQYEDMTFAVVRTARYMPHDELTETSEVIETGAVMLFIGEHFVITVRHGAAVRLKPVREELESRRELLAQGPWAVFHAVVDRVVDVYLDVSAAVETDLDELEASVFSRDRKSNIQEIYQLKRELVEFKRAVFPLQRPLQVLVSGQISSLPKEPRRYIRDVNDHLQRVVEQIAAYDDLINSVLQARLAQVTVDQNNDMRKIAAWAAIAAVPTAIAGIYGMNFDVMPELKWKFGYPFILTLIVVACAGLYRFFRRSGWL
ncbi:magnesium/cobalt transporter CorA [Longispora sp. K20-0274]|uniref:magnesium/cobalt transporter CorA n=1 Tax=Longispora sp. K20-0274 TaxID=3088255 RepID=UPI003999DC2E